MTTAYVRLLPMAITPMVVGVGYGMQHATGRGFRRTCKRTTIDVFSTHYTFQIFVHTIQQFLIFYDFVQLHELQSSK